MANPVVGKQWTKNGRDFFRCDGAYAGKDHTKNNKTYIILGPLGLDESNGFKSIDSAMKAADKKWIINA